MVVAQLLIVVVSALVGGLILSSARDRYSRAHELTTLVNDDGRGRTTEEDTVETVEGPITVERSPAPEQRPPEHHQSDGVTDAAPALWAWRVRRERDTDNGTLWKTVDSGLAVGEWTIRDDWARVRVDADRLRSADVGDPFTAERLFLGDPDVDVHVEERDGLLDGLGGEFGPLEDVELSVSVGGETTTPDKYQATVLREGDEMLVRGHLDERNGAQVVNGGDGGNLEVAVGDLGDRADRLARAARTRTVVGASVLVLGIGAAVGTLL